MEEGIAALRTRVAALPPARRAAFRAKVEAAGVDWALVAPPEAPAPRPARLPLSPAQTHFWLLQQVHPESAAFTIALAWEIEGPLDREALRRALDHLVRRHEPLRTGFPSEDGRPWQEIAADPAFRLEEIEVAGAAEAEAAAAERRFAARPFDLAAPPLFRAALLLLAPERFRLLLAFHHIVADGWSRGVFMRELAECFRAFRDGRSPNLEPLARQFADLALEEADWLGGLEARAAEAFWRAELAGLAPQELPSRGPSDDRAAETSLCEIDPALAARIAPEAAALGVSPFVLLLAAFQLLLHRLTGGDDIAVGAPVAGRETPEAERLIGLFVNTLTLRARPRPEMTFRLWLDHVRSGFARAFEHRSLPFARVVEAAGAPRRPGATPLFQTLFQAQTGGYARQNADNVDLGDPRLKVSQRPIPLAHAKFDLSWHMLAREDGLSVIVERRAVLFTPEWGAGLVRWFETLLAAALDRPDAAVGELDFVPPGEAETAILRGPDVEIPTLSSLLAPLRERDDAALVCDATGAAWSGRALDEAAERLARRLLARPELAGAEPRIAIQLERGPGLVVALLAAIKAGVAYAPLDPAHPSARRDAILRDAGAALLLASADTVAPCPVLDPATLPPDAPEAGLPAEAPDRIAYLIHTSGSTGRPKGVPVTRRALANLLASTAERPRLRPGDRLLAITTIGFDIAALELLLPLATGATLILADAGAAGAPDRLSETLARRGVSHMQATPATWRLLVESGWKGGAGLTALSGGEALPSDLGRALLDRTAALWNMYGPTETTIWSAARRVTAADLDGPRARIGDPVANTTLRALDGYGATLPPGLPGELAIGGAGLSPGYWGRPDLDEGRFVGAGAARLYRTGDRVRLEPDGSLTFLGRLDHQIKLNGHRIEPGEIEAALVAQPGIAEALVAAEGGRLVAWLRAPGGAPEPAPLRAALAGRLPAYMIPASFVTVDAFPLNANGKIDRARLPRPGAEARAGARAAETATERTLLRIWSEVLERDDIGAEDNFFDLGGASVSAMRIASRARAEGLVLTPAQMFEHQTIAEQARAAAEAQTASQPEPPPPFSPWQSSILDAARPRLRLRVPVEPGLEDRLAAATAELEAAHPALRHAPGPDGWREAGAAPAEPLWRARVESGALELSADPLLLDASSVERAAGDLLALMRGEARLAASDDYADWLRAPPAAGTPELAPFPGDGPDDGPGDAPGDEPALVIETLEGARLAALRAEARALRVDPSRIVAAALGRALARWAGGPISLALVEDAPGASLGCRARLVPLRLDAAASPRAVDDAAAGALRGVDPRDAPEGLAVLCWRPAPALGEWAEAPGLLATPAPALVVAAEFGPERLSLAWRFDPSRLRRQTALRLAARHLAEIAAPREGAVEGKLDRLRSRLEGART